MKKITFIVVSLLLTLFSYSQDFNRVIQANKSEFKDGKWVTVDAKYPKDMFLIMKDWDITIGTYKLKTYDIPDKTIYDDHITYTWKAVNPDGEKCFFMMKRFNSSVTTHMVYCVVYEQFLTMYEYECE